MKDQKLSIGTTLAAMKALCVLICCSIAAVQGSSVVTEGEHQGSERHMVGTGSAATELKEAIGELKALLNAADDLQRSLQRATARHAGLLRDAQADLKQASGKGESACTDWAALCVDVCTLIIRVVRWQRSLRRYAVASGPSVLENIGQ